MVRFLGARLIMQADISLFNKLIANQGPVQVFNDTNSQNRFVDFFRERGNGFANLLTELNRDGASDARKQAIRSIIKQEIDDYDRTVRQQKPRWYAQGLFTNDSSFKTAYQKASKLRAALINRYNQDIIANSNKKGFWNNTSLSHEGEAMNEADRLLFRQRIPLFKALKNLVAANAIFDKWYENACNFRACVRGVGKGAVGKAAQHLYHQLSRYKIFGEKLPKLNPVVEWSEQSGWFKNAVNIERIQQALGGRTK